MKAPLREPDKKYLDLAVADGLVPPHDLDAEAAVLSACMLASTIGNGQQSSTAYHEIADVLEPEMFYSERHRRIFESIRLLSHHNAPVDSVTVADFLKQTDKIGMVGGLAYLMQIMDAAPLIQNVRAYAEIIRNAWRKRQMILTLKQAAIRAYGDVGPSQEFLEAVVMEVSAVAESKSGSRMIDMHALVKDVVDDTRSAHSQGRPPGIATGIRTFDNITSGGLHRGGLVVVAARPGIGKAQPVDEPVMTPTGWRAIGSLKVGDLVTSASGFPTRVLGVHRQGRRPVFVVTMNDGGQTRACAEHLWFTQTRKDRKARTPRAGSVKTTAEIAGSILRAASGGLNHSVPVTNKVRFVGQRALPLDPWLLGVMLGDGMLASSSVMLSNPEADIQARVASLLAPTDRMVPSDDKMLDFRICDRRGRGKGHGSEIGKTLRALDLRGCRSYEKFIPNEYLFASETDRLALLQGLWDTDGYVLSNGRAIEYTTTSLRLCEDVRFIVGTLGGIVSVNRRMGRYRVDGGEAVITRLNYRMVLSFPRGDVCPVTSAKHLARWSGNTPNRVQGRFIESVEADGDAECVCIEVEAADRLYVTKDFIVTHNTSYMLSIAKHVAAQKPMIVSDDGTPWSEQACLVFSLEMPRKQIGVRLLAFQSHLTSTKIRTGRLADHEWTPFLMGSRVVAELPIFVDDTSGLTIDALRSRVRSIKVQIETPKQADGKTPKRKLAAAFVDYIQLMRAPAARSRVEEIGLVSRGLKALAKDEDIAVVAGCQLNRALESRAGTAKRPMLSDLRESGDIEQDADDVIGLHRNEAVGEAEPEGQEGYTEQIWLKQRNGPTGTRVCRFTKETMLFDDMPGEY